MKRLRWSLRESRTAAGKSEATFERPRGLRDRGDDDEP
jgi:hypothetical protein